MTTVSPSPLRAPVSSIRRKPLRTYQSPSVTTPTDAKTFSSLSPQLASASASTSSSASASTSTTNAVIAAQSTGIVIRTSKVPRPPKMAHPLPLYHPFHRLALSLPPLEPAIFGHHSVSLDDSDTGRRASARSRRPAAKLRDADEDELPPRPPIPNVSAIAAVAAREIKEKASPRKRRGGGGGGAGAKRKRKEIDDGDATYPAKRTTRNPRGASTIPADDGSPSDSVAPLPEVTPTPEADLQLQDDSKRPERRSTRSNGASKRRDSSASETTSVSASGQAGKVNGAVPTATNEAPSDVEMLRNGGETREAKEEGEVSEEAP